ncbi:MAG: serine acetyltransferase [Symploca sp. SIO1C2]|nr:serine acetyltransferase [Symploca sp. SIO1C2]
MLDDFKADIKRYELLGINPWFIILITRQGLWIMNHYRFSRWVHHQIHFPVIRQVLKILCIIWQKLIEIITGCEFPNRAEIGKGLYMPHPVGITIHTDAKLGENCNLGQHVTIGVGGRGENRGIPKLGDRVFVGPGACIFGSITIGNDVAIGANAVVTKDLPDNAVAVGIPAKIINYKGSQHLIDYPGKDSSN